MKLLLALHTSEGYQSKQEHLCALIILTEHTNPNLVRRSPSISLCGTRHWFPGLVTQPCCSSCCSRDGWQTTGVAVLAAAALLVNSHGEGGVSVFWRLSEGFPPSGVLCLLLSRVVCKCDVNGRSSFAGRRSLEIFMMVLKRLRK